MRLKTERNELLLPLQQVVGVVERRQTLPVLANVLMVAEEGELTLTATDLEVELVATTPLSCEQGGRITVPARKLLEILRSLPEDATVSVESEGERLLIRAGRSRFILSTLPAADFPALEDIVFETEIQLLQGSLRRVIDRTHFSMAHQDVRYYLNGLLLEVEEGTLRAVATDGHRLSVCHTELETPPGVNTQVIVPRKGVQELLRLLTESEGEARLRIGANHIQLSVGGLRFTSKLIEGKFPDYRRVIPAEGGRVLLADRQALRTALGRTAILANEKYRGVRLQLESWLLRLQSHNPEQEEAEEEVEVNYEGGELEIGFNVTYLLDALGALDGELVKLSITDAASSCLIQEAEGGRCQYVVMPMRL